MKIRTLPLKVALPLFAATLIALSFACWSFYLSRTTQDFLFSQAQRDAKNVSKILMHVLEAFRGEFHSEENQRKLQRIVENIGALPSIHQIFIVNPDGSTLAGNGRSVVKEQLPPHVRARVADFLSRRLKRDSIETLPGNKFLLAIQPLSGGVYDPSSKSEILAVQVIIFDLSKLESYGREQFRDTWWIFLVIASSCVLLTYLIVAQRILKPLSSLQETVKAIGQSDLHAQAMVYRDDELGQIAQKLNLTVNRLRDVTVSKLELERVHDELLATQLKMIQASKMASLGEMAAGVAHEINNPLGIISARGAHLTERAENGTLTMEQATKWGKVIEQTSFRIAKIVHSLRWFAREGEADPFVETSVAEIVRDTIELCQARFRHHNVELVIKEIPATAKIECRPVQISQVLLNLLNNAHDAVELLEKKWVQVEYWESEGRPHLVVTDSGSGIAPEIAAKIMDPFFTTKEVGKGTGLGLSLSQGIIDAHGGQLVLDRNCPNTRFLIIFPLPRSAQKPIGQHVA